MERAKRARPSPISVKGGMNEEICENLYIMSLRGVEELN